MSHQKEIAKDILLNVSQETADDGLVVYSFEVENARKLAVFEITLDCSTSVNFTAIENNDSLIATTDVQPCSKSIVLRLKQSTAGESWSLMYNLSGTFKTPSQEVIEQYVKEEDDRVKALIGSASAQSFLDPEFPPVLSSFSSQPVMIQWRRPTEFVENGAVPCVFLERGVLPTDIALGETGPTNPWLHTAFSVIAEEPDSLKRLFRTQTPSENGRYEILLSHKGKWKTVSIDDYLPCRVSGGPFCARGDSEELWPNLLEKAYAKQNGGYQAIVSGLPLDALQDLTGAPTARLFFSSPDGKDHSLEVFKQLYQAYYDGFIPLASTEAVRGSNTATFHDCGLIGGVAYRILQVVESGETRLVQVRDPWGTGNRQGDWSATSSLWTEELKQQTGGPVDGTLWFSLSDFAKVFTCAAICYHNSSFHQTRLESTFTPCLGAEVACPGAGLSSPVYLLHAPSGPTRAFLSLHLNPNNSTHHEPGKSHPVDLGSIFVLKPVGRTPDSSAVIYSLVAQQKHETGHAIVVEVKLEQTHEDLPYLVIPSCFSNTPGASVPFLLKASSDLPVFLEPSADDRLLRNGVLTEYCKQNGKKTDMYQGKVNMWFKSDGFVSFVAAENVTDKMEFTLKISFTESKNVHFVSNPDAPAPLEVSPVLTAMSQIPIVSLIIHDSSHPAVFGYGLSASAKGLKKIATSTPEDVAQILFNLFNAMDHSDSVKNESEAQYQDDVQWGATEEWKPALSRPYIPTMFVPRVSQLLDGIQRPTSPSEGSDATTGRAAPIVRRPAAPVPVKPAAPAQPAQPIAQAVKPAQPPATTESTSPKTTEPIPTKPAEPAPVAPEPPKHVEPVAVAAVEPPKPPVVVAETPKPVAPKPTPIVRPTLAPAKPTPVVRSFVPRPAPEPEKPISGRPSIVSMTETGSAKSVMAMWKEREMLAKK